MASSTDLFWYLLLAHFIADYPLQTAWMVRHKTNPGVLLLHVSIHLAIMLLIVGSAAAWLWPYLLALAGAHYLIDALKILAAQRYPGQTGGLYVLDQACHYLSIGLVAVWAAPSLGAITLPASRALVVYALGYLTATYVWLISERVLSGGERLYQQQADEQAWPRMLVRAALLTALLLIWKSFTGVIAMSQLPVLLTTQLPVFKIRRGRAWIIDVSVAAAAALLVILAA